MRRGKGKCKEKESGNLTKKLCMGRPWKNRRLLWQVPAFAFAAYVLAIAAWMALSAPGLTEILPWKLRYWTWWDLREGAVIVANVERFRLEHGRLPDAYNTGELVGLGFEDNAVATNPLYSVDGGEYEIRYVEGFDGPYIVYSSRLKEWYCELC
jgi:hypothetical protein